MAHVHVWTGDPDHRGFLCKGCGIKAPDSWTVYELGGHYDPSYLKGVIIEKWTPDVVTSYDVLTAIRSYPGSSQGHLYTRLGSQVQDRLDLRSYLGHFLKAGYVEDRPEEYHGDVAERHAYFITEEGEQELHRIKPLVDEARTAFARRTYQRRADATD